MKAIILTVICLCLCLPAQAQQAWLDEHPKTYKALWFLTTPLRLAKRVVMVPVREVVTGYRVFVIGETPEYADAIAETILER